MKPHGSDEALSNTSLGVRRDGFQPHSASEREKKDRLLAKADTSAALVDLGTWRSNALLAAGRIILLVRIEEFQLSV